MAKLKNKTKIDISLPSRHVIPRLGELTLPNETIKSVDNWPQLSGAIAAGDVDVEFDPEPRLDAPGETSTETVESPDRETPGEPLKVKLKPAKP